MRQALMAAAAGLVLLAGTARAGTVDEDLVTAVQLMAELQACAAGGLTTGGVVPRPEDLAAVRRILAEADPLLREATTLARRPERTPQDDLILAAWVRGSLAMLAVADDYRQEQGY